MGSGPTKDVIETLEGWEEAFDRQVALGTTNEADLAGHYPFSPERFRVFVNGTRQFVQYGPIPEYEDLVDGHRLKPQSAGDVVTVETTERYRYVVQYVIEWSAAFQASQSLQSGEALIFGFGDADLANSADDNPGPAADGWFWHFHSALDANEVRLVEYRDGTAVDEDVVELEKALTIWKRLAAETNWYNVGNTKYTETYTYRGLQKNPTVGKTSVDDAKGPQTANKPVQLSVKAEAGAGSLEAELGSVGVRTLGRVRPITREKTHTFSASIGTAGAWVPIGALRVDPNRDIVNVQLDNTDIVDYSDSAADVRVMPLAVAPEKALTTGDVQPTDWTTPAEHNEQNSVIEVSSSVTKFPESTGSVVTSTSNPGGHQLGYASNYSSGTGSKTTVQSGARTRKRNVSSRDVCVFVANATATGTVTIEVVTEQDW